MSLCHSRTIYGENQESTQHRETYDPIVVRRCTNIACALSPGQKRLPRTNTKDLNFVQRQRHDRITAFGPVFGARLTKSSTEAFMYARSRLLRSWQKVMTWLGGIVPPTHLAMRQEPYTSFHTNSSIGFPPRTLTIASDITFRGRESVKSTVPVECFFTPSSVVAARR
jgi:hypothetical protein